MPLNYLHIYLLMIADRLIQLRQGNSPGLQQFVPKNKWALKKNNAIRSNLFNDACRECQCLYDIPDGKPGCVINCEDYISCPANLARTLPGKSLLTNCYIRFR